MSRNEGIIAVIVRYFLTSKMSIILIIAAILMGTAAIMITPREEEPQIVVPMADVMVQVPGASSEEVERLVTAPLERLLWQIDGVEYVYSVSRRDMASVTVRFFVGENREDSLIKLHNAITKNLDLVPGVVSGWAVKPIEIDDVPIVTLTLHESNKTTHTAGKELKTRYSDHDLRRMAEELFQRLAETEDVSRLTLHGGRPREVRVELQPERMTGYGITPLEIATALRGANRSLPVGDFIHADRRTELVSKSFLMTPSDVRSLVVGVVDGRPVYLRDVASVIDGPIEPATYSRIGFSHRYRAENGLTGPTSRPAVTLAVAKKRGANAVDVARSVTRRVESLRRTVLPDGVAVEVTRNYGRTAQTKVNDLLQSLAFAVATVVVLLAFALGWREALVVAVAVPVSFSLALFCSWLLGYTINRVTLFALILSLGLVVDDPITNVDNIQRHILIGRHKPLQATLNAVQEVLPPVIMSTLAIIVCFLPLFFITGMMGPYMAPMAANVPLTVTFSTLCALTIVPWMAFNLLKDHTFSKPAPQTTNEESVNPKLLSLYRKLLSPLLESSRKRRLLLFGILAGLGLSAALVVCRLVPLKMLPFDNKNELQLVVDLPEDATLEGTDRVLADFETYLAGVPEVNNWVTYAGAPSPMDFNGMVRHYYWRESPELGDIRINLVDKSRRNFQSHAIALRLRKDLTAIANRNGADLKIVESPPGPPVISTLTAEVYGLPGQPYADIINGARHIRTLMQHEPGVVDTDTSSETDRTVIDFYIDKEKAALHGIDAEDIVQTMGITLGGESVSSVHAPGERQPLPVRLVLPHAIRTGPEDLGEVRMKTASDTMVPLAELGRFQSVAAEQPIWHKNLRRVAYTYAETAGIPPGEAVLDLGVALQDSPLPPGLNVEWDGEGEWKITIDVFRDLGIAFVAALLAIYVLLIIETGSFIMPMLIMSAIPLTLLGIMPGFWLLNLIAGETVGGYANPVFFTATSMIGMIALGGIVIRNSVVLIDFFKKSLDTGRNLKESIIFSGAVRLRPIALTALTTALGAWPITLDPIFSGLAWALIFGLAASTLFTLLVIPCGYYALYEKS